MFLLYTCKRGDFHYLAILIFQMGINGNFFTFSWRRYFPGDLFESAVGLHYSGDHLGRVTIFDDHLPHWPMMSFITRFGAEPLFGPPVISVGGVARMLRWQQFVRLFRLNDAPIFSTTK